MSLLLIAMDVTIVNVALPAIQHDLHATIPQLQWIIDAYTLVLASLLILSGSCQTASTSPAPPTPISWIMAGCSAFVLLAGYASNTPLGQIQHRPRRQALYVATSNQHSRAEAQSYPCHEAATPGRL
jgi:MFS family permease